MKMFAHVIGGKVAEIIEPFADEEGNEIPIASRFHPDIVSNLVDITGTDVEAGWSYQDGTFAPQPQPTVTQEQVLAALTASVQQHLDDAAKQLGYDSIFTAVTYADEPAVPKFQQEGQALRTWRSQVWAACYAILAAVKAGTRTAPSADDVIAELPVFAIS